MLITKGKKPSEMATYYMISAVQLFEISKNKKTVERSVVGRGLEGWRGGRENEK